MEMIRVKVLREATWGAELHWKSSDNHHVWVSLQHIESITLWGETADIVMDSGNVYTVENVNMDEVLKGDNEKW